MRCPDCSKFVSLETADEPEEQSLEVTNNNDGTATATGEATLSRNCGECSQELKQGSFEIEDLINLDAETDKHEGHTFSVHGETWEVIEDSEPKAKQVKSRKTGKIEWRYPNPRYVRTVFSVKVAGEIMCDQCSVTVVSEFEAISGTLSAGSFDEMV